MRDRRPIRIASGYPFHRKPLACTLCKVFAWLFYLRTGCTDSNES